MLAAGRNGRPHDRTMDKAEIYLVPGFLGFARLADLHYFIEVGEHLERRLAAAGIAASVVTTATVPVGSLRKRAEKLAEEVAARHDPDTSSVHFVGHSTGGLDVRLLLSPGSELDAGPDMRARLGDAAFGRYADALGKVRSATAVATPHFGTPIASVGVRLSVDALLRTASQAARWPGVRDGLALALSAAAPLADVVQKLPVSLPFLDWIDSAVLSSDPLAVLRYLDGIGADIGALRNLTQEAADLADALLVDRPAVDYGSVVTGTNEPLGAIKAITPLIYANSIGFRVAWYFTADRDPAYEYASRTAELRAMHVADDAAGLDVGDLEIDDRTNDGIVPTESQAHGRVLAVLASDHLDCVGHFPHTLADGTEVSGWVRSGAGFGSPRFELLWDRVADFMATAAGR